MLFDGLVVKSFHFAALEVLAVALQGGGPGHRSRSRRLDDPWAAEGLAAAGVRTYEEAVAVRDHIAAASGAKYELDDVVCFVSLTQHK